MTTCITAQEQQSNSVAVNDQTLSGNLDTTSTKELDQSVDRDGTLTSIPSYHNDGPITYNLRQGKPAAVSFSDIFKTIKARVGMLDVVKTFDLEERLTLQRSGYSLQGSCPTGHPSKSHLSFSIDLNDNLYHCFNCGEAGDIIQLVELTEHVSRLEAVRLLIDKCAPDLKPSIDAWAQHLSPEERERYERAALYKLVFAQGKRLLYEPEGKLMLDYLVNVRGYDRTILQSTDWIYWDTETNTRSFLLSREPGLREQIKRLPLNGAFGDAFRLAIPFRDRNGMITGFLKRAHERAGFDIGDKIGIRWDSTKGLTKPDLFGLHRIRNQRELVIVEGYPDAVYLPSLGLENIVACGQAAFSEKYIEGLHAKQINRIILALDNDGGTGISNSREICKVFAGTDIDVFVLDPPLMGQSKDPDEYVQGQGIEAFRKLIANAERASTWMTRQILLSNEVATDLGKAKAIDEVLEMASSLVNPLEVQAVVDTITTQLSVAPEMLDERYQQLKQKIAALQVQRSLQGITGGIQKMVKEGSLGLALHKLRTETDRLIVAYGTVGAQAEIPFDDFLTSKHRTDATRIPDQRLGYALTRFPSIDNAMCGLQPSMIAIGADPNTGKTILTVNLAVDILNSNADASVLFYTLDDTRDAVVSRFVANLTSLPINDVQRKARNGSEEKLINDAYGWLSALAQSDRLDVKELVDGLTMASINEAIRNHPCRSSLVVVVDGMYNIPMDGRRSTIREDNIERANCVKELVKLYKVPVIVTAELRKRSAEESKTKERTLHDIMETGKYAYNADVVCLLTPSDLDRYSSEEEPIMKLDVVKNKLSSFRGTIPLLFTKHRATFAEGGVNPYGFTQGTQS